MEGSPVSLSPPSALKRIESVKLSLNLWPQGTEKKKKENDKGREGEEKKKKSNRTQKKSRSPKERKTGKCRRKGITGLRVLSRLYLNDHSSSC